MTIGRNKKNESRIGKGKKRGNTHLGCVKSGSWLPVYAA